MFKVWLICLLALFLVSCWISFILCFFRFPIENELIGPLEAATTPIAFTLYFVGILGAFLLVESSKNLNYDRRKAERQMLLGCNLIFASWVGLELLLRLVIS